MCVAFDDAAVDLAVPLPDVGTRDMRRDASERIVVLIVGGILLGGEVSKTGGFPMGSHGS